MNRKQPEEDGVCTYIFEMAESFTPTTIDIHSVMIDAQSEK